MSTSLVPDPAVDPEPGLDVALTADNLVALCEELCADAFSLCDGVVTFTRRRGGPPQRWRGVLGTRGLARV